MNCEETMPWLDAYLDGELETYPTARFGSSSGHWFHM
jgi:hypothetical protein